jgi:hypothetical protein
MCGKRHITGLFALRRLRGFVRLGRLRLPRLTPPTFLQALETCGFLCRACKNVIYSRNVRRHCFLTLLEMTIDNMVENI